MRRRASSPKLQVLNTALMTAVEGLVPEEARADRSSYGRLVESAIGANLADAAQRGDGDQFDWRETNREVDFVVREGKRMLAIGIKSGRRRDALPGMAAFVEAFEPDRTLLVGADGIDEERYERLETRDRGRHIPHFAGWNGWKQSNQHTSGRSWIRHP